jgi:hypothetical protein
MRSIKKLSTASVLVALSMVVGITSVKGDLVTAPTVAAYDYDFTTGTLSTSYATITFSTINNIPQIVFSDPKPPDPANGATFFGVAKPIHFCDSSGVCDTVVFTQSACTGAQTGGGPPGCNEAAGTLTFGDFFMYSAKGDTLSQITNLATRYYIPTPDSCGVGSPRWTFTMVNSAGSFVGDIWAYIGPTPSFGGCLSNTWTNPDSGINYATDSAGNRWDGTPVGCLYGTTFTVIKTCADAKGLTIANVFLSTDGGGSATAAPPPTETQTVYFQSIQVNSVTRFP